MFFGREGMERIGAKGRDEEEGALTRACRIVPTRIGQAEWESSESTACPESDLLPRDNALLGYLTSRVFREKAR